MVPTVRVLDVAAPALVIGSTQPVADVAPGAGGRVDVVCRHSGGGAVLVTPSQVLWVDVLVPAGDDVWDDDVGRATHWLGQTWALALGDLGIGAEWYDGALVAGPWARLACFGGLGPGEVRASGRKVVGISQRRTRAGALFQCAALLGWDPTALVELLALDAGARRQATSDLEGAAAGLAVDGATVEGAFLARLATR